ncbi:MAG: energy transducer TonB [Candidatus Acidiferrales bacterium]
MVSSCSAHRNLASAPPAPSPSPAPVSSSIPADVPAAGTNGYTAPICSYCPAPQYSPGALREKIQGQVVLDVVIGTDGHAHNMVVKKSLGHGLDEQAIRALHDVWLFNQPRDRMENRPPYTC